MVVSSGKEAVSNQAMLYSVRKPVMVLKDDGKNVFATRSYSLYLNINEGKRRLVCEQCCHYDLSFGVPDDKSS